MHQSQPKWDTKTALTTTARWHREETAALVSREPPHCAFFMRISQEEVGLLLTFRNKNAKDMLSAAAAAGCASFWRVRSSTIISLCKLQLMLLVHSCACCMFHTVLRLEVGIHYIEAINSWMPAAYVAAEPFGRGSAKETLSSYFARFSVEALRNSRGDWWSTVTPACEKGLLANRRIKLGEDS